MDAEEIRRGIEAILFAAGEPVGAERMALAMGISVETIHQEAKVLQDELSFQRRGVRIVTLEAVLMSISESGLDRAFLLKVRKNTLHYHTRFV